MMLALLITVVACYVAAALFYELLIYLLNRKEYGHTKPAKIKRAQNNGKV